MSPFLKCFLALAFILPSTVQAKPCGRGFIADNKVCHKDSGGYLPVPVRKVAASKAKATTPPRKTVAPDTTVRP